MGEDKGRIELRLRCFGYPGKNNGVEGFFGHCIDLNLTVWRSRYDEIVDAVNEQVQGYLEAVAQTAESHEEFEQLLHRPSPIAIRARFHMYGLVLAIPRIIKWFKGVFLFTSEKEVPALQLSHS